MTAVNDEIMSLGFAGDRIVDGCTHIIVVRRCPQRRQQVCRVVLSEAHVEYAGASKTYAIAAFAKIMRKRRDETKLAAGFAHAHIARRTAGSLGRRLESVVFG